MDCTEHTLEYVLDIQTIAYDLCKSVTLDASLLKYKPSVLAACMIFLGFQMQFELNLIGYEISTEQGRSKVAQICEVYRIWLQILENALEVPDVPKIIDFCDMLFERQVSLYEEYKT